MAGNRDNPRTTALRRRAQAEGWGAIALELGVELDQVDPRMKSAFMRFARERDLIAKLAYVAKHYIGETEGLLSQSVEQSADGNELLLARKLQKIERDRKFATAALSRGSAE